MSDRSDRTYDCDFLVGLHLDGGKLGGVGGSRCRQVAKLNGFARQYETEEKEKKLPDSQTAKDQCGVRFIDLKK